MRGDFMSRLSKMPDINEVGKMSGAELLNLAVREANIQSLTKLLGILLLILQPLDRLVRLSIQMTLGETRFITHFLTK